jgi:hypothetical protein
MTDRAPAVTGKPLRWLRLDGLVLLAAALILVVPTYVGHAARSARSSE